MNFSIRFCRCQLRNWIATHTPSSPASGPKNGARAAWPISHRPATVASM